MLLGDVCTRGCRFCAVTSGDPRSVAPSISTNTTRGGMPVYFPSKYTPDGAGSYPVASGIEARLIEAEAALRAGDGSWLEKLNHLRRTEYTTIRPAVTEPLPDLTDPGTDETRVDLLFRGYRHWVKRRTGGKLGKEALLPAFYGGRYYLLAFDIDFQIPNTPRRVSADELSARFTPERGWQILDLRAAQFHSRVAPPVPAVRACIERRSERNEE